MTRRLYVKAKRKNNFKNLFKLIPCSQKLGRIANNDTYDFEYGDKAVLPQEILSELLRSGIEPPYIFKVFFKNKERLCGVRDFSAPAGTIILPKWLLQKLRVRNTKPKKLVTLKQHLGIRELMEQSLGQYSTLSTGEVIPVQILCTKFDLRIELLQPSSTVSLLGKVDMEVDFAPPTQVSLGGIRPVSEGNKENVRTHPRDEFFTKEKVVEQIGAKFVEFKSEETPFRVKTFDFEKFACRRPAAKAFPGKPNKF
eukprot:snap_masked-scaffold_1-processed-gene-25.39-mRNA-1 protein AED:1.00 eAED:1.00 QI:0/0/0/0/1/1/2/0/253